MVTSFYAGKCEKTTVTTPMLQNVKSYSSARAMLLRHQYHHCAERLSLSNVPEQSNLVSLCKPADVSSSSV